MLEKRQLCPATPDTRIETTNVPPSRGTPSSDEHIEHHSFEVDYDVVVQHKITGPGMPGRTRGMDRLDILV